MKKLLGVVLSLSLVLGAHVAPAEAGKKKAKPRKVTATYGPAIGFTLGNGVASGFCAFNYSPDFADSPCLEFVPKASEKFVRVTMTDATGMKVSGELSQGDTDGDGFADVYGEFCGGHKKAIPLQGSAPVKVFYFPGTCGDGTPSLPTTGTITVQFAPKPF